MLRQVGEDRGGQLGGEVVRAARRPGMCPDAEGAQALAEPGRGDGLSGHAAGEQPRAGGR